MDMLFFFFLASLLSYSSTILPYTRFRVPHDSSPLYLAFSLIHPTSSHVICVHVLRIYPAKASIRHLTGTGTWEREWGWIRLAIAPISGYLVYCARRLLGRDGVPLCSFVILGSTYQGF